MHYKSTVLSIFCVLFVVQVYSDDLMCYVCDDCAKVNDDTPLLPCDAGYFSQVGTTEASTVTSPASGTTDKMSTEEMSPTTFSSTTSTITTTTEMTTSDLPTETTEAPIPTPPTVGPMETTTAVPTPPSVDIALKNTEVNDQSNTTDNNANTNEDETTIRSMDTELIQNSDAKTDSNSTIMSNSTTEQKVDRELVTTKLNPLSRRRRALNDVTYHCYSVLKKNASGSLNTVRGCSRVTTMESVCNVLNTQNPGVELSDCNPCSMSKCNGSSALSVSLLAIAVALFAGFLRRN